jgi:hypothetical protein
MGTLMVPVALNLPAPLLVIRRFLDDGNALREAPVPNSYICILRFLYSSPLTGAVRCAGGMAAIAF